MVDGTGLENQQINVSQVRILSLPPCLSGRAQKKTLVGLFFSDRFSNVGVCVCRCVCDYYYDFASQLVLT